MNIIKAHNLVCPIDGEKLTQKNKQLVCDNGHTFDIARQGYVNLLPVQHKRTKQPGDSKAMVLARTEFLNSGIYQPIARQLTEIVFSQLKQDNEICLLDAGCGEGYYSDAVINDLSDRDASNIVSFVGLDISKDAIIQSTKRNKDISWVVGTNRQPPVENESVDIILCLFGFLSVEGFNKILKPGGKIILVDPGPGHLKELREIIYAEVKKQDQLESLQKEMPGFSLVERKSLRFKEKITNNEQLNHLLIMTPHFYRASKEGRATACNLPELEITVDVVFRVMGKI
jgi:23S rRNA (guanine745-N1)-methyltransferase